MGEQLVHVPEAVRALEDLGVDVPNLTSLADHLFEEDEADEAKKEQDKKQIVLDENGEKVNESAEGEEDEGKSMTFAEFLELVIRLRAENTPSVADIVELRKVVFKGQKEVTKRLHNIEKEQTALQNHIRSIMDQLDAAWLVDQDVSHECGLDLQALESAAKAQKETTRQCIAPPPTPNPFGNVRTAV